ncbi:hypothetical protein ElyMa_004569800 [Elysia marginata]|uniref:Uncharacterized protein n=1 Tax=Elysia marginata TaxID=1093978 RepID=A0AAV4HTD7_9GAST|nr:hypothetical protein ElyMa_004569800 [Elysia marginata]
MIGTDDHTATICDREEVESRPTAATDRVYLYHSLDIPIKSYRVSALKKIVLYRKWRLIIPEDCEFSPLNSAMMEGESFAEFTVDAHVSAATV